MLALQGVAVNSVVGVHIAVFTPLSARTVKALLLSSLVCLAVRPVPFGTTALTMARVSSPILRPQVSCLLESCSHPLQGRQSRVPGLWSALLDQLPKLCRQTSQQLSCKMACRACSPKPRRWVCWLNSWTNFARLLPCITNLLRITYAADSSVGTG